MMSKPQRPKLHGSIPGYIPGRPILSRGQKNLLWGLLVVPIVTYGVMKMQEQRHKEQERLLEVEGRAMWETKYGKSDALNVDAGKSDGGI